MILPSRFTGIIDRDQGWIQVPLGTSIICIYRVVVMAVSAPGCCSGRAVPYICRVCEEVIHKSKCRAVMLRIPVAVIT